MSAFDKEDWETAKAFLLALAFLVLFLGIIALFGRCAIERDRAAPQVEAER